MSEIPLKKIQLWADRILNCTHKLALGPNVYKTPIFSRIVEAAFRRDYLTLSTIRYLSNGKKEELAAFGNSCMDLSRRVLEDDLYLKYMIATDKEELSKKFNAYRAIETKNDLDYLKAAGSTIDPEVERQVLDEFDEVKADFFDKSSKSRQKGWKDLLEALTKFNHELNSDLKTKLDQEFINLYPLNKDKTRKNWSAMDVESIILELEKTKVIPPEEARDRLQFYYRTNDKNHFSPRDLLSFLYNDLYEANGEKDMRVSLFAVTGYLTEMALIFCQEFDVPLEVKTEIENLYKELAQDDTDEINNNRLPE